MQFNGVLTSWYVPYVCVENWPAIHHHSCRQHRPQVIGSALLDYSSVQSNGESWDQDLKIAETPESLRQVSEAGAVLESENLGRPQAEDWRTWVASWQQLEFRSRLP
jgi:hypothetical protein